MKKLLSFLLILTFFVFILSGLYVFEIPPFKAKPENPEQEIEAEQIATETLSKIPRAKTYEEYISRATALEKGGYSSLAIATFQEAAKMKPENTQPLIEIGKIHLREGVFVSAEKIFQDALILEPENINIKILLVRSLLSQRKIEEANDVIKNLNSDSGELKYYQGIIAAFLGDYEKSESLLKNAAQNLTSQDLKKKAENFLNAYNEFNFHSEGQKTHLKTLLARSFNQTGEYEMAIPLLFEVIKERRDYRDAWVLIGYSYLSLEKYPEALESFLEAKKLDTQKSETYFFLGLTYFGSNDLENAKNNLEQAKKLGFQPIIQVDQKLAEIYLELGNYQESVKHYENVLTLNDQDINYYIRPIWIYLDKINQPEKAVALAEKALIKHQTNAMSYNLLAWSQIKNKQLQEGETNLNIALQLNPNLDAIYLNFGLLEEQKNNFEKAVSYYQKAHQIGNGNSISTTAVERYNKLIAKMGNSFTANIFN